MTYYEKNKHYLLDKSKKYYEDNKNNIKEKMKNIIKNIGQKIKKKYQNLEEQNIIIKSKIIIYLINIIYQKNQENIIIEKIMIFHQVKKK